MPCRESIPVQMQGGRETGECHIQPRQTDRRALTAEGRRVYKGKGSSSVFCKITSRKDDSLSKGVVQELVAPEVALQPADIQAVRVVETSEARQLDGEADFVARVLLRVAVYRFQ